jgi:alkylation response protein AidB-like acyl-CoA dehydrogenase
VDFAFTEEQSELADVLRSFLTRHSDEQQVRALMETDVGFDPAVWRQLATGVGVQGLAIPEQFGGQGAGFVELGLMLKEAGRSLLVAPLFSTTVLAAHALLLSGDERACSRYLPRIAAGELVATVAVDDAAAPVRSSVRDGSWRLSGTKTVVLDGLLADLIIVTAQTDGGLGLFTVEAGATGLGRESLSSLDPTRKLARLDFDDVEAQPLGDSAGSGAECLDTVCALASVGLAAEQLGGAQRCLELSVAYAKDRIQFGRPIGSFQSIKHLCADMLLEVERAAAAVDYALWAAAERTDDLPVLAAMTKALCSDVYSNVAFSTIQVHGGIGFTWEHPAHLYLRRARSSALMFGTADEHRERMLQRLGV